MQAIGADSHSLSYKICNFGRTNLLIGRCLPCPLYPPQAVENVKARPRKEYADASYLHTDERSRHSVRRIHVLPPGALAPLLLELPEFRVWCWNLNTNKRPQGLDKAWTTLPYAKSRIDDNWCGLQIQQPSTRSYIYKHSL